MSLIVAALAIGATSATSNPTTRAAKAAPKKGGSLVIMAGQAMPSWDPATQPNTIPGVQADRFNAVYGNLVYTDLKGQIQPDLATGLTSKDYKTWTLKLRPNLKFTDGAKLDAAAVKFNWDRITNSTAAVGHLFATSFTTKVVNATTLVATLNRKDPTFALRVAELIPFIASPSSLPANVGTPISKPVGAGPFMFDSQQAGVSETVVRNPGYYDKKLPYLDKITWRFVSDPAQRVATVVQGDAQYMNGYTFQFQPQLGPGFSAYKVPAGGLRMFMFNLRSAPFNDVRLRRAVALAVNPADIVQALVQDPKAQPWRSIFASSSPYYSKSLLLPATNTSQAQKLVDQVTGGSKTISFDIVVAGVPELQRAGQVLQLELNKINGLKANLKVVALQDWRNQTFNLHNFDITFYPGVYDLNGAEVQITGLFDTGGAGNFAGFNNRLMNNTLASARAAATPARKKLLFAKVQKLYLQYLPVYVFGLDYRAFFHTDKIGGFTPMGSGAMLMKDLYWNS